uniref:Uncharacterized protein n=1 Tax=Tanacetum cinerariifolium TaxID=118510 RepID=A0A699HNL8_TANCI|nr:hypothetical protein [Tanacetum cinerariifolium]
MQTNQFARPVSAILGIVQRYMDQRMNEAVKVAIQIQSGRLYNEAQGENDEFLKTIDENMQKIIKEQVKEQVKVQVSMILPKIEQTVNEQLEAEVLTQEGKEPESASAPKDKATRSAGKSTQGSKSRQTSASESATAEELMQTTFEMEGPSHLQFETGADDQPIVQSSQHPEWFSQQKKPPTLDCDWNKTLPANNESIQPWISELAKQSDFRSSFNELMDTLVDFFNFLMNRLRVDTLTLKLLAGPTYELMKGSCKSLVELEYQLEEVYKATTDQLDWVNPEGKLINMTVEEHFSFNVSLRMFTRSIVIQRRMEDLQLGVESYQKKLNLTKPDTYRSDLKRKEAYIAYSNPRGFIYQNKDKQNKLMRIDELHKFSDGMLIDVRIALDDRLKGIQMKYLPQSIWRKSDKDRASAMIQAINKRLKTMRIMKSLEMYIRGRLYEGDFKMLQRTI